MTAAPISMPALREKYAPRKRARVQQGDAYGCAIACLAMAAGTDYLAMRRIVAGYCDAFYPYSEFDGLNLDDEKIILFSLGLNVSTVRRGRSMPLKDITGFQPAILCVPSLNVVNKSHAVFWTGRQLHDPSPFRQYDADGAWDAAMCASIISPLDMDNPRSLRGIDGGVA